jgi:cytochrome P450
MDQRLGRPGRPTRECGVVPAREIEDFRGQSRELFAKPNPTAVNAVLHVPRHHSHLCGTEALRPRVKRFVDELIDDMLRDIPPVDLVEAFALPVPSLVICELLGVSYAEHAFFQRCSHTLISRLVDAKDREPADDVLSRLVVNQLRTGALTRSEVADMAVLLLVAGHETTANMIALGTLTLLRHPDQLAELREADNPKLVANAVEELLRYLNITHTGRRRVALEDVEVGGQLIRAGEGVIAANGVANRDETAFPDPDALDIHRQARPPHGLRLGHPPVPGAASGQGRVAGGRHRPGQVRRPRAVCAAGPRRVRPARRGRDRRAATSTRVRSRTG